MELRCADMTGPALASGHCECGAVRFTIAGPLSDVVNCHCSQCRRIHGHVRAFTDCALSDLVFAGQRGLRWYQSSATVRRGFCCYCGSSLFRQKIGDHMISVAAGCLNKPTGLKTASHIFVADRGDYYEITDGLKQAARRD